MTMLDAQLVDGVGLDAAPRRRSPAARARPGSTSPRASGPRWWRGSSACASTIPRARTLELLPNDPATRAEAAYSAAQLLHSSGWLVPVVQGLSDTFSLPQLLDVAAAHPRHRRRADRQPVRVGRNE